MKKLNDSIYTTIFTRKSTRRFLDTTLPQEKLDLLQDFIAAAVPLFPAEQAAFEIQPHKGNAMKIAAYAKQETAAYLNLAFLLQQMDLFLQLNGMGAVWNATVRATKKQYQGLPYGICLVFGMPQDPSERTSASQFKRKPAEEISNAPKHPVIEAVRLAPSARNQQPWYLSCKEHQIDFYYKKGGFIENTLLKGMHWFDVGIAVCHAVLALQQEGLAPEPSLSFAAPAREGYLHGLRLDF